MQFKSIIAVFALALTATATAIPLENAAVGGLMERTNPTTTNTCSPKQTSVFCQPKNTGKNSSSGGLVGLTVVLNLLSGILTNALQCVPGMYSK